MLFQCAVASCLLLLTSFTNILNGQEHQPSTSTTEASVDPYDPKNAYCFEFTWLGPEYDNTVEFELTCEEYLDQERVSEFIPCRQPLVITNDSSLPDLKYLWENYKSRVVRKQRKGEVCAKYSFLFNNEVSNITYMRTKVFAVGEGAVTSGCYSQTHGGTESELCVCEATPGDYMPCNDANVNAHIQSISFTLIGSLICMFIRMLI